MGPRASLRFIEHLIDLAQSEYGAKRDADFPHIHMHSVALEHFDAHEVPDLAEAQRELTRAAHALAEGGADIIAVPCNSVHSVIEQVAQTVSVPFLNTIRETAAAAATQSITRAYVIGTHMTAQNGLYPAALSIYAVTAVFPSHTAQEHAEALITHIEEGSITNYAHELFALIVADAQEHGADGIILGCTELSLLPNPSSPLPIIDSSRVLAQRAIDFAFARTHLLPEMQHASHEHQNEQ
jgi:aspartate racemase